MHTQQKNLLAAMLCGFCLASQPLPAAVFERDWKTPGDGLLTYDDVTGREWLDLTESRLSLFDGESFKDRFENAQAELAPGGSFNGFFVANRTDVVALASSAGIVGEFSRNNAAPVSTLIQLVGISENPYHYGVQETLAIGVIDELSPPLELIQRQMVGVLNVRREPPRAGFGFGALSIYATVDNTGMFLFRQAIPEPSTLAIAATCCMGVLAIRGRLKMGRG